MSLPVFAREGECRRASALLRYWPYIWTLNGRAEDKVNPLEVDSQAISREGNGHPRKIRCPHKLSQTHFVKVGTGVGVEGLRSHRC